MIYGHPGTQRMGASKRADLSGTLDCGEDLIFKSLGKIGHQWPKGMLEKNATLLDKSGLGFFKFHVYFLSVTCIAMSVLGVWDYDRRCSKK